MKVHRKEYHQFLPITLNQAWDFFSRPQNLNEITPEDMQFEILTEDISRMYQGQIVQYNVTPFPLVKLGWVTEITHVDDHKMFVDEQRFGPYAFWHHQHIFEEVKGGVKMTDILHYRVPLGAVGKIINALVISKKVEDIFEYRFKVLDKKFGTSVVKLKQTA